MSSKIKVLWFCSAKFTTVKTFASGTWLHTMASALVDSNAIELYNITQGPVKKIICQNSLSINQWIIPYESLSSKGLPSLKTIKGIQKIVDDIRPDIIHIWGTENYWGLLTSRELIKGNIILEIQGLKFTIEQHFYSGLSLRDVLNCIGFKEFFKPDTSLIGLKRSFRRWGKFEKEMIRTHKYISTQSNWVRSHIKNISPYSRIHQTSILLRSEFIEADKWDYNNCNQFQIFTSTSSILSYKGLHVLIAAIALLVSNYPQIKLFIAGNLITGFKADGYSKWLRKKIRNWGIEENIIWLGSINAKEMIQQMYKANVVVIPSFVESYCLAVEEALSIGAPTIASFAGAIPELATHKKSALFFPPGDITMCASLVAELFTDNEYAKELSRNAYLDRGKKKNTTIVMTQQAYYKNILDETSGNSNEV